MQEFLEPTTYVNCEAPNIKWEIKRFPIHKASDQQKVSFLFNFVRDNIDTQVAPDQVNPMRASEVLTHGYGSSIGKANLLAAFCRACGIPAALSYLVLNIRTRCSHQNLLRMLSKNHGITSVWLHGHWVLLDPSLSCAYAKTRHSLAADFDGEHDALLPQYNRRNKLDIQIVERYGLYADPPEHIIELFGELSKHQGIGGLQILPAKTFSLRSLLKKGSISSAHL